MLVSISRAPAESFAADSIDDSGADGIVDATEKGGEGLWAGSQMALVTGFQTNVNSRIVFAGGIGLFSDEYARKELPSGTPSGNSQLARDIAAWIFLETLTLHIDSVELHRVNQTVAPEMYTTDDQIVSYYDAVVLLNDSLCSGYTAHISSYDSRTSIWKPYSGISDLQLEFTMLDPHIHTSLPPVPGSPGTYLVQRHGVFKFVLNWKRKGCSYLSSSTIVAVVPSRHDEYPHFLSSEWPYYAGAISTSVGFFLFAALWLAGDVKSERKKGTKSE
ncbi:hypothetical protein M405DRAFT_860111 [Rhizopogon salebrosus TDB-379]|nr:hypothetical protein M405DRAFT_860111 [Rhizopogon salebrosus TDB-379]